MSELLLPAKFPEEAMLKATGDWAVRTRETANKLAGSRDLRSPETLAGIQLQAETNWYKERYNAVLEENRRLVERIHHMSEELN